MTDSQILFEFPVEPGVHAVARSPEDLAKASAEALDRAMGAIREMCVKTKEGLANLASPPDSVGINFGVKVNAEAGVVISKVSGEAALEVQLTWNRSP
jgi:hypothetical protein